SSGAAMKVYDSAEAGYLRVLPRALQRPGLVLAIAALVFAAALAIVPTLGTDLIPQLAQDRFEMTIRLPPGTPLRETDRIVREVQARHAGDEGIEVLFGFSGTGTRLDANPTESGENIGKLSVVMAGGGSRELEEQLAGRLRETMRAYPRAQVDFSRPALFSFSSPLEIELHGYDLDSLSGAGRKMAAMLRANPNYTDVKSTVEQGAPEIQIRFDQERAGALGLTTRDIADAVVRSVRGEVATRYNFRDRKIDVLVRAQEDQRDSVEQIRNLVSNAGAARPARLSAGGDVGATVGPSERRRAPPAGGGGGGGCGGAQRGPRRRPAPGGAHPGQPGRHRPGHRGPRSAADGGRRSAGRRHRDAHRRAGRGACRFDQFAAVRL